MIGIKGSITGNYAHKLKVAVYTENFQLVGVQLDVEDEYEIEVAIGGDYIVILIPSIGQQWKPNTKYFEDDPVIPNNYDSLPYVFVCENSGISGSVPPTFLIQPFTKIYDAGIEWRLLERIPFPLIQYPVKAELL